MPGASDDDDDDLTTHYDEYLDRFATQIGAAAVGSFAKYRGELIKKLTYAEFAPAYTAYTEVAERYRESVERGDTINDAVVKLLRTQAANLVLHAAI